MENYDSKGAQQQEIDSRVESGVDWQGTTLYQDEQIYEYDVGETIYKIQFGDLMEFAKTLPKEELIESLEMLSEWQLAHCLGAKKTHV